MTPRAMAPASAAVFAPAKINLALHVTGRRDDEYHLLDSLVVFADVGDRVTVTLGAPMRLRLAGPLAADLPAGAENLALRAAALIGAPAEIVLEKHLPAAAGLGGGSSDAAAVLRALAGLAGRPLPLPQEALALGSDVPVCLLAGPARMRGIGERVEPVAGLPPLDAVLVNPGVALPTGRVFARLARPDNPPLPDPLPCWHDAAALIDWLGAQRNDLEPPALALAPAVGAALDALREMPGCGLARMSGSGATCFGLFPDASAARDAAAALARVHPGWWVRAARLQGSVGAAAPCAAMPAG